MMRKIKSEDNKKSYFIILQAILVFCFVTQLYGINIQVIKEPKPTCVELNTVPLQKIKNISNRVYGKYILAFPTSITADKSHIYIFERSFGKIFKFDMDFNFVQILDTNSKTMGFVTLNIGKDGNLYLCDFDKRLVSAFDPQGKILAEHRLFYSQCARVVVDRGGNLLLPSIHDGILDIFTPNLGFMKSLLDLNECSTFLISRPSPAILRSHVFPHFVNVAADIVIDGKMIIYLYDSSKYILLNSDGEVILSKFLWPRRAMECLRKYLSLDKEDDVSTGEKHRALFIGFFVDSDDERHFYLHFGEDRERGENILYEFDLEGSLIRTLTVDVKKNGKDRFVLKKNQEFFAISPKKEINIYKELTK